jgi:hypothetical protein
MIGMKKVGSSSCPPQSELKIFIYRIKENFTKNRGFSQYSARSWHFLMFAFYCTAVHLLKFKREFLICMQFYFISVYFFVQYLANLSEYFSYACNFVDLCLEFIQVLKPTCWYFEAWILLFTDKNFKLMDRCTVKWYKKSISPCISGCWMTGRSRCRGRKRLMRCGSGSAARFR